MKYEVIQLEEKTIVGVSARTNNQNPDMPVIIGGLWEQFFSGMYDQIQNKKNDKTIGLYSDYENQMYADYNITVGCEVSTQEDPIKGAIVKRIPAGKYAKFVIRGHAQTAIGQFWEELWKMDLKRTYAGDFEEYQPGGTLEDSEIHVYLAIE